MAEKAWQVRDFTWTELKIKVMIRQYAFKCFTEPSDIHVWNSVMTSCHLLCPNCCSSGFLKGKKKINEYCVACVSYICTALQHAMLNLQNDMLLIKFAQPKVRKWNNKTKR